MKPFHLMLDTDREHRLCDGQPIKLPLPKLDEVGDVCEACDQKMHEMTAAAGNDNVAFGAALSLAK